MLNTVLTVIAHFLVGGISANLLVIISLASVACGHETGSCIRPARRLPKDSDAQLFKMLFGLGGVCGLIAASVSGFSLETSWLIPTGIFSFLAGLPIAFSRVKTLNEQYLARAKQNFAAGQYAAAIEDASEVARSSEQLRKEAKDLVARAKELRQHGAPSLPTMDESREPELV